MSTPDENGPGFGSDGDSFGDRMLGALADNLPDLPPPGDLTDATVSDTD